jgi:hypothetical protein
MRKPSRRWAAPARRGLPTSGFLIFNQSRDGPDRYGALRRFVVCSDPGHVHSMETGGPFPLCFVHLLRFVLLKGCDKLIHLYPGKAPTSCLGANRVGCAGRLNIHRSAFRVREASRLVTPALFLSLLLAGRLADEIDPVLGGHKLK